MSAIEYIRAIIRICWWCIWKITSLFISMAFTDKLIVLTIIVSILFILYTVFRIYKNPAKIFISKICRQTADRLTLIANSIT